MTLRPCLTCSTPTRGTYCRGHQRDPNLARRALPTLLEHFDAICQLCGTHCRGGGKHQATIHHINGNVQDNRWANLTLYCRSCNTTAG